MKKKNDTPAAWAHVPLPRIFSLPRISFDEFQPVDLGSFAQQADEVHARLLPDHPQMGMPGIGKSQALKKIIKRMKKERKEEKRALKKAKKHNR